MRNLNVFIIGLKRLELDHWLFMQRAKEESIKPIFRNGFNYVHSFNKNSYIVSTAYAHLQY
jgi:hypothetical protein